MLTARSDAQALAARLDAVTPAVEAAVAAYVRARQAGVVRTHAISAFTKRARALSPSARGMDTRREAAWGGEGPPWRLRRVASPLPPPGRERGATPPDAAALKAVAVRAALTALGRSQ